MIIIISLIIIGALVGRVSSHRSARVTKHLQSRINLFLTIELFALLFLLGGGVGSNKEVVSNLPNFGLISLIIMIFAITGSVLLSTISYKFFIKTNER